MLVETQLFFLRLMNSKAIFFILYFDHSKNFGFRKSTNLSFYFRHFSTNEVSLFSLDVAKNVNQVINVILKDVGGTSTEVCQEALQVLGVILHDQDIVRYELCHLMRNPVFEVSDQV